VKTQETKKDYIFGFTFLLIFTLFLMFAVDSVAQDKTKSEWVEKNTVEIPYSVEINVGTTKSGNPKYWIDIEDISVSVSAGNYEKFIKKEIVLVLVEWYNPITGKYKYTTRQKAKANIVKKLNLDELW
jgi:hypothetical protein